MSIAMKELRSCGCIRTLGVDERHKFHTWKNTLNDCCCPDCCKSPLTVSHFHSYSPFVFLCDHHWNEAELEKFNTLSISLDRNDDLDSNDDLKRN